MISDCVFREFFMPTLLLSHDAFLHHAVPEGHPERPDRMRALRKVFSEDAFQQLVREDTPLAPLDFAGLAHPADYVHKIAGLVPTQGFAGIDADTIMSAGTMEAALRALGGATRAVDAVFKGEVNNAFLAARPPGHHAEHDKAMGFCFFNTAAVAANYAKKAHGAERIAIIDWDVHHGNGTQDIFWADKNVLYASTHQMPLYPGTGAKSETGEHNTIVNAPLSAGDDGEAFRAAMTSVILPRIKQHQPDMIIISAGFDAHYRDPLANLQLTEQDFGWATRQLMAIAEKNCKGRIVSVLEGGYDLIGLADSASAHVKTLMEA
jgi:acetoin utilization deacetylase AcuC-like enzyme